MALHLHSVTFDAADPPALARFWAAVTGYDVGQSSPVFADLSAVNTIRQRSLATSGNTIIGWLATRSEPLATGSLVLGDDPADTALVEACEQWLVASAPDAGAPDR